MAEHTHTFETVLGDHVAGKEFVVFGHVFVESVEKRLHILNEIRMNVGHHAADAVIIECHAGTACLLHYVKHLLTYTQRVEEHCCGTEVHTECADKEAVRRDTRKLVHQCTHHYGALRHLNSGSFLYAETETVVVVVG